MVPGINIEQSITPCWTLISLRESEAQKFSRVVKGQVQYTAKIPQLLQFLYTYSMTTIDYKEIDIIKEIIIKK